MNETKSTRSTLQSDIDFLEFWNWEYQLRASNEGHFRTHEHYKQVSQRILSHVGSLNGVDSNGVTINSSDFDVYMSADEMLSEFISRGVFVYKYARALRCHVQPLFRADGKGGCLNDLVSSCGASQELCSRFVDAISEFQCSHKGKLLFVPDSMSEKEAVEAIRVVRRKREGMKVREAYEHSLLNMGVLKRQLLKTTFLKRVPPSSDKRDINRAVGLWLWDYVEEHKSTPGQAVKQFLESFGENLSRLGLDEKNESDFHFFYRKTDQCIADISIHSFSKR